MIAGRAVVRSDSPSEQAQSGEPSKTAARNVQGTSVYTVAPVNVDRAIVITGELQAARSVEIKVPRIRSSSQTTITYLAPEGEVIKEGQPLVTFDASSLLSQMSEQQRNVDESVLTIEKTKKDQEASRSDLLNSVAQAEGQLKIAGLNAAIPKDLQPANTYLRYQNDLEKAKLSLQKAKEQLANFDASYDSQIKLAELRKSTNELTLRRMQGDLELLSVKAPQDGVVIYGDNWQANRRYQIGDQAFQDMTVIILPDLSSMNVTGFVYDTELQYLAPGIVCNIHLDAVPGRDWQGKIESLTSVATRKGFATTQKVFKAVVRLDSVDLSIMKPGMTARAEAQLSMASDVIAVPRPYVGIDTQSRYYVLKETGPETPPTAEFVKTGVFGDTMVQILSGLTAGDRVLPVQTISENK